MCLLFEFRQFDFFYYVFDCTRCLAVSILKLEDLTVLKRSPDLLNNVKIGQDQLRLIMKQISFYVAVAISVKWPKKYNEYSIKHPNNSRGKDV